MDSGEEEYYYSDEDDYSMGDANDGGEKKREEEDSEMEEDTPREEGKSSGERRASAVSMSSSGSRVKQNVSMAGMTDEYSVLTPELLELEQEKLVNHVAEILDIEYDTANVLLLYFHWNKEKLLDSYYADSEGTCRLAGAIGLDHESATFEADAAAGRHAPEDPFVCQILFMEFPFKFTFAMGCGHRFSVDAWQSYLRGKVEDGKDCIFASCPSDQCHAIVSPKNWEKVLNHAVEDPDPEEIEKNKEALEKFKRFLATSFVEINRTMRYCPGKNCKIAIKSFGAITNVKCTYCGSLFCFKCGQEAHAPTTCSWLAKWEEKCNNESETANWILANTKKCPKCATRIEKNQGCNHMSCKVCKFDFCWICLGSWTDHGTSTGGYYNCNRYKSDGDVGDGDKRSLAKRELDRYLHYYKRYEAHKQAGKFAANEQRERAERRMVEMQTEWSLGWVDVQFLIQAVDLLVECRRVLKNTYIHAFYLPSGPKKELFEYLQSVLESHTEKLSELSEKEIKSMDRADVINYTRVTGQFLHSLLEQVDSEGIGMDDEVPYEGDIIRDGSEESESAGQVSSGEGKESDRTGKKATTWNAPQTTKPTNTATRAKSRAQSEKH